MDVEREVEDILERGSLVVLEVLISDWRNPWTFSIYFNNQTITCWTGLLVREAGCDVQDHDTEDQVGQEWWAESAMR